MEHGPMIKVGVVCVEATFTHKARNQYNPVNGREQNKEKENHFVPRQIVLLHLDI